MHTHFRPQLGQEYYLLERGLAISAEHSCFHTIMSSNDPFTASSSNIHQRYSFNPLSIFSSIRPNIQLPSLSVDARHTLQVAQSPHVVLLNYKQNINIRTVWPEKIRTHHFPFGASHCWRRPKKTQSSQGNCSSQK
jgi:hypothetical protein